MITDNDIIKALQIVFATYGKPFAARIEQLFRNETRHFTSGNFLVTLSPGMQATTDTLPYGWISLAEYWKSNPKYEPTGIYQQKENNSAMANSVGVQKFMVFPSIEASMMSVAHKIHTSGHDDAGTWFDNNPIDQKKYDAILDTIIPRFVNAHIG